MKALLTELSRVRGRLRHWCRTELPVARPAGPFHLRDRVPHVAAVALGRVVEMIHVTRGRPANGERRHAGRWCRAIAQDRVLEIVVVLHVQVGDVHGGSARHQVDINIFVTEHRRPEEPILPDAWVEVSYLRAAQTGVEDVNSNESKRSVAHVTVATAEDALHEAHVVEQPWQGSRLPGLAVAPLARTTHESDGAGPLEVEHGSRIGVRADEERRALDVRLDAWKELHGRRNRFHQTMPGPSALAADGRNNPEPVTAPNEATPAAVCRKLRRDH
jgi:hypothetical protein